MQQAETPKTPRIGHILTLLELRVVVFRVVSRFALGV